MAALNYTELRRMHSYLKEKTERLQLFEESRSFVFEIVAFFYYFVVILVVFAFMVVPSIDN